MTIDPTAIDARLGAFAAAELPDRLDACTVDVTRRIAGRRPPRPASAAAVALTIVCSALVGLASSAVPLPAARASALALQPALSLAPSTLLDPPR